MLKLRVIFKLLCMGIIGISFWSCSTPPKATPSLSFSSGTEVQSLDSQFQIKYVLGHDSFQFSLKSTPRSIDGEIFSNKKKIVSGQMEREKYNGFLKKLIQFKSALSDHPTLKERCKSPFKITIRIGNLTETGFGCRTENSEPFSKLIREAEFLLLSKK